MAMVERSDKSNPEIISFDAEMAEAERKAIESLAKYKFAMFGYWAGIWIHLNRISGSRKPNPFQDLVKAARKIQNR
jgi:hypothetical protein